MPTAAPAYPGGQDGPYPNEKARYSGSHATPAAGDAEVYGGYQDQPSASLDNPHSPGLPGPRAQDGLEDVAEQFEPGPHPHAHEEPARASLADDEDYGYNVRNRVLRVRCPFMVTILRLICCRLLMNECTCAALACVYTIYLPRGDLMLATI